MHCALRSLVLKSCHVVLALVVATVFSGCAALSDGTSDRVTIHALVSDDSLSYLEGDEAALREFMSEHTARIERQLRTIQDSMNPLPNNIALRVFVPPIKLAQDELYLGRGVITSWERAMTDYLPERRALEHKRAYDLISESEYWIEKNRIDILEAHAVSEASYDAGGYNYGKGARATVEKVMEKQHARDAKKRAVSSGYYQIDKFVQRDYPALIPVNHRINPITRPDAARLDYVFIEMLKTVKGIEIVNSPSEAQFVLRVTAVDWRDQQDEGREMASYYPGESVAETLLKVYTDADVLYAKEYDVRRTLEMVFEAIDPKTSAILSVSKANNVVEWKYKHLQEMIGGMYSSDFTWNTYIEDIPPVSVTLQIYAVYSKALNDLFADLEDKGVL